MSPCISTESLSSPSIPSPLLLGAGLARDALALGAGICWADTVDTSTISFLIPI